MRSGWRNTVGVDLKAIRPLVRIFSTKWLSEWDASEATGPRSTFMVRSITNDRWLPDCRLLSEHVERGHAGYIYIYIRRYAAAGPGYRGRVSAVFCSSRDGLSRG